MLGMDGAGGRLAQVANWVSGHLQVNCNYITAGPNQDSQPLFLQMFAHFRTPSCHFCQTNILFWATWSWTYHLLVWHWRLLNWVHEGMLQVQVVRGWLVKSICWYNTSCYGVECGTWVGHHHLLGWYTSTEVVHWCRRTWVGHHLWRGLITRVCLAAGAKPLLCCSGCRR